MGADRSVGAMQVVGAGVGRTGTHSLKVALELLLGGPCHHMVEVFAHPEQVPVFHDAALGKPVDWHALFAGYVATVDWPGGAFWRELSEAYPDALVLLSTRESAEVWWKSADRTVLEPMKGSAEIPVGTEAWMAMVRDLFANRFTDRYDDKDALMAAYERHNAAVREGVPADRLLEWQPGDGWGPICERLGVDVPDEPFPVTNTTEEFRAMLGLPD
jgi:hypothetical protein